MPCSIAAARKHRVQPVSAAIDIEEWAHNSEAAAQVVEGYGRIRALIEAAQAEGAAWPGDAQLMGETLICGLQGIAHSLITIPEYPWMAAERLLDQMLTVVLRPGV